MKRILMLTGAVLALSAPTAHAGWFDNYVVLDKSATDPHIQEQIKLAIHDNCARVVLPDAAERGDEATVKKLIAANVDVNQSNALDKAVQYNETTIVQMLLAAGAIPTTNALTSAVALENIVIAQMLIAAGAMDNDHIYYSALNIAVRTPNPAMVQLLLDNGAQTGEALHHLSASSGYTEQYAQDIAEIIAMLVAKGADINALNTDGDSAIDTAIEHANHYVLQALINFISATKLEVEKTHGYCPLDKAINTSNKHGNSRLDEAVRRYHRQYCFSRDHRFTNAFTCAQILENAGATCSMPTNLLMALYSI